MTDSGKSARDKATDRLAAIFRGTALDGASQTLADTEAAGASFLSGERSWVGWCARANATISALGLVAIDPALVEAAAKPKTDPYCDAHGNADGPSPHGGRGLCRVCDAKMRLADAVLAQMRAKP